MPVDLAQVSPPFIPPPPDVPAYLLSLFILVPLVAALILLFIPAGVTKVFKALTITATGFQLVLASWICTLPPGQWWVLTEKREWFRITVNSYGTFSADYHLMVDGISAGMIWLATLVLFIGALASYTIKDKWKGYSTLYLLLSASVVGCFLAMDMLLFYVFFEFMLLPMYFLIGIWGGERREYAAIKFFIYTLTGSILILVVMIGLVNATASPEKSGWRVCVPFNTPERTLKDYSSSAVSTQEDVLPKHYSSYVHTFNIQDYTNVHANIPGTLLSLASTKTIAGMPVRYWAFILLFIGFAVKIPVVPFHTWLPDAHVEAPAPISAVLAGILLKVGGYGLIRIAWSVFPDAAAHFAWWVGLIGVITIIYGALNALGQTHLKKMIAYSSISHMGFVVLGIASFTAEGLQGAIYQMISHGIISAMLFILAGMLYDRTHNYEIDNHRGLLQVMPVYTTFVTIAFFASLGLPLFSGFIAELMVLVGAFSSATKNGLLPQAFAVVSTLGIVLSAGYYLWCFQKMFLGKPFLRNGHVAELKDITPAEALLLAPLAILTILLGIWPQAFVNLSDMFFMPLRGLFT